MTTLQINTERSWRGGEQQTLFLALGLREAGHMPIVIAQPDSPLCLAAQKAGLDVRSHRVWGELDLIAAARIARRARLEGAALLHAHTAHAHGLALLATCLGCQAKVVVTRRVDFPIRCGWKYGQRVSRFIAISEAVRDVLQRGGVPADRITLVHSGIDLRRIDSAPDADYRKEFGFSAGEFVIGNVAHLADHKGQKYLIAALPHVLAKHPEARLLIVGEGELREELASQVKSLGLDRRVIFTGFRRDVPGLMKFFDLFVMSSHLEGLCTSIMDAMAARRPIVASAAGGIPELIANEVNGLLVPPKDPAALASSILRMIDERDLAARLAAQGRRDVEERFSSQRMVEGTLAVYRQVLAESGGN